MKTTEDDILQQLMEMVAGSDKYAAISPELIRAVGEKELVKRRTMKEAVKETRNKLHQVGSAFQEKPIPYAAWKKELAGLPTVLQSEEAQEFLQASMAWHASTAERLSILPRFFQETLASLAPVTSILDLACGLNPLCLPWMPVAKDVTYAACDIYQDMTDFMTVFFDHFHIHGNAFTCDLSQSVPGQSAQVALLLKTIPCLDQVNKNAAGRLLRELQADYILVSFPAHSLGGRNKGMKENYEARFESLIEGQNWKVTRFDYVSELAFLIEK